MKKEAIAEEPTLFRAQASRSEVQAPVAERRWLRVCQCLSRDQAVSRPMPLGADHTHRSSSRSTNIMRSTDTSRSSSSFRVPQPSLANRASSTTSRSSSFGARSILRRSAGYPSLNEGHIYSHGGRWQKHPKRSYLVLGHDGLFEYRGRGEVAPAHEFAQVTSVEPVGQDAMRLTMKRGKKVLLQLEKPSERDTWVDCIKLTFLPGSSSF